MNFAQAAQKKKIFVLAIMSIMVSTVFSILGAPFLKTFAATTRSIVFWSVGVIFVSGLMLMSQKNSQLFQIALYAGAIWMTLGMYNEFEKRGINWRYSGLFSILAGYVFAFLGLYIFLQPEQRTSMLTDTVNPIFQALQKSFPDSAIQLNFLVSLVPGMFIASLVAALALGFLMEQQIVRVFQIKKLKVASALKWLEFRLPSAFVWVTLFAMLFSIESFELKQLKTASTNVLIVSAVALFFQGMTVIEFALRRFKMGLLTRVITYLLIFLQLSPFVAFVGLADFWVDFRMKMLRQPENKSDIK